MHSTKNANDEKTQENGAPPSKINGNESTYLVNCFWLVSGALLKILPV